MIAAFVVPFQQHVENSYVAVVRETEVADDALFFLLDKPVENAVVDEAAVERGERVVAAADGMQQEVIDVINLQFFQRVAEHRLRSLARPRVGTLVRHFRGDEKLVALVAAERDACGVFRQTAAITRRRVEIIHAVRDGIIHEPVHRLLVDFLVVLARRTAVVNRRQAHHSETEQRHFVARVMVGAVSHCPFAVLFRRRRAARAFFASRK